MASRYRWLAMREEERRGRHECQPRAYIFTTRLPLTPQVIFHFAKGTPHPDITVVVVSFLNFNSGPLTNLEFQAAVPKVCLLVDC
jgi:hypothetical protein